MLAIVLALCAATSNAVGSVFQRRAARNLPDEDRFSWRLVGDLFRRPAWLAGVGGLIGGFLFQASALNFGALALVQPLLAAELPLTLLLAKPVLHRAAGRQGWQASAALSAGLALLLLSAAPRAGNHHPSMTAWLTAAVVTGAILSGVVGASRTSHGPLRSALLAGAAGLGFGATAAVMKVTTGVARHGITPLLSSWPVYAMVAIGILSFYLLQNAFQSGPLLYAQPAVTIVDPIAATIAGLFLFHDTLRGGPWIGGEIAGAALLVWGILSIGHATVQSTASNR